MILVDLKKNNRTFKTIELPENIDEVSLSQAIQFNNRYEKYRKWSEENDADELTVDQQIAQIELMANCVSGYLDLDVKELSKLKVGSEDEFISAFDSVYGILAYLISIMETYQFTKPEDSSYKFVHHGIEYSVRGYYRNAIFDNTDMTDLSLSEAIECLEVKRLALNIKNKDNAKFTEMITTLAVLSRRDGELFPENQFEIDEFVNERVKEFQDINMKVAYDVAFFLTNTLWN